MQIKYTAAARNDLRKIRDYICNNLSNPIAASRITKDIIESCDILAEMPLTGAELSEKIDMETEYRYLISGHYIVFYVVLNDYIRIDRIIDGRTQYLKILFE